MTLPTGGQPTVTAAYTWGAGGLVSERLVSQTRSLWYHFGPQGETRQLTNASGSAVDAYVYTAYGVPVASTGTDPNPFRFGGQVGYYTETNPQCQTVLCGARWYSPVLGRWLSRDPIGYEGGPNLYEYCDGDPVGGIDPSGLSVSVSVTLRACQRDLALHEMVERERRRLDETDWSMAVPGGAAASVGRRAVLAPLGRGLRAWAGRAWRWVGGTVGRLAARSPRSMGRAPAAGRAISIAGRSFFHRGALRGGRVVVRAKEFSTCSTRAEVESLPLTGPIHEFRVPEEVLSQWLAKHWVYEATTQMKGNVVREWRFGAEAQRLLEKYRTSR